MYIYLSERKRRMFLSLSLPQNLSPKKLSPKDQRFLQKSIVNITMPLSELLIKQQKKLYEKHIGFPLKPSNYPPFVKKRVSFPVKGQALKEESFSPCPPLYFSLWQKCQNYKSILFNEKLKKEKTLSHCFLKPSTSLSSPTGPRKEGTKGLLLPIRQGTTLQISYKGVESGQYYEKPNLEGVLTEPFLYNALCIYTQPVKVKNKSRNIGGYRGLTGDQYPYNISSFERWKSLKNYCSNFENAPFILQKFTFPPIFVNGQNKYWFCRFLYNREHIYLSINPQIVKNKKSNQRTVKSRFLHEKKKIALFYGQIAKRDLTLLSKKAQSLPGGFEDNMYTLLESRIDVCLQRAGFSKTIAMARQYIRQGVVFVNGKKISSCKVLGKPGDIVCFHAQSQEKKNTFIDFCYKNTAKILYNIYLSKTSKLEGGLPSAKQTPRQSTVIPLKINQNGHLSRAKQSNIRKILRDLCVFGYTDSQCSKHWLNNQEQKPSKKLYKKQKGHGYLSPGFFFYKNLCKKTSPVQGLPLGEACLTASPVRVSPLKKRQETSILKALLSSKGFVNSTTREYCIFLNVYIASIYKRQFISRSSFGVWKKKESIFSPIMKNLQNANCAGFWGQKPLNLEISQKTATFIYLYPPQKIISPICIDFNTLKC